MTFKIKRVYTPHPKLEISKLIKASGARKIGSGSYGVVYHSKTKNIVYKTGNCDGNEGYLAFLRAIAAQKTQNPYFPKIASVTIFSDRIGNAHFLVIMEKLTKVRSSKKMDDALDWFGRVCQDEDEYSLSSTVFGITIPKMLQNAVELLKNTYFKNCRFINWDIHQGNFMKRGEQIVCIDPFC